MAVFLGTSIVGTLAGGYLADRLGRRKVIRMGFAGGVLFLALFAVTTNRSLALGLLVPLAVFLFMPTSVLVVLGQEYLPRRVGMASGVTLGLAVSVGGMCAAARALGRSVRVVQCHRCAHHAHDRGGMSGELLCLRRAGTVDAAEARAASDMGQPVASGERVGAGDMG